VRAIEDREVGTQRGAGNDAGSGRLLERHLVPYPARGQCGATGSGADAASVVPAGRPTCSRTQS
jgi:hypothetical protein